MLRPPQHLACRARHACLKHSPNFPRGRLEHMFTELGVRGQTEWAPVQGVARRGWHPYVSPGVRHHPARAEIAKICS